MPFQSIKDMFSRLFSGQSKEDEVPSIAPPPAATPSAAAPSKPREIETYGGTLSSAAPPAPLRAEVIATARAEEAPPPPVMSAVDVDHDGKDGRVANEITEVKSDEEFNDRGATSPIVKPAAKAVAATNASTANGQTKKSDREPSMSSASGESSAPKRNFAPSSAEDSLLDLGEVKTNSIAPTISDNEDVILDLGDEPAFAPAAWENARVQPSAAKVVAPPSSAAAAASSSPQQTGAGAITADQLSPEVIEAIAKRVVEHLSTKVIEEIAWDVVPQLAELMVKRQLDQTNARRS